MIRPKTIYLFASLGNRRKTATGGGQISARRLVKVFDNLGFEMHVVNRTISAEGSSNFAKLYKYYGFIVDPVRWFCHLLLGKRKESVTLVVAYSGSLFPYYFTLVRIAKFLGYKTIIYVKGGFTEKKFSLFPVRLQQSFRSGLLKTDIALFEGEEGSKLSKKNNSQTKAMWIPNYVENDFAPCKCPNRKFEEINLLYFGRIHPNKNLLIVVDAFNRLCGKFSNVNLTIVGSGQEEYEQVLNEHICLSPYKGRIQRIARLSHDQLKQILKTQHFFVFPSEEQQEGHSNALNEAMSFGLVPVVSNNNFLPDIVNNSRLVANNFNAETYANIIDDVIESGDFERLSHEMYERVKKLFTQSVVEKKLKDAIDS